METHLSEEELKLVRELEKLIGNGAALGRDRDQVLGRCLRELEKGKKLVEILFHVSPYTPVLVRVHLTKQAFDYKDFKGDTLLEVALLALKAKVEIKIEE